MIHQANRFESETLQYLIEKTIEKRGSQYPNPAVGAAVVKNNQIISEGFHLLYGHDHAEVIAISKAGHMAQGATLLVTLEPCVHHGKTPPCVEKIVSAGIKRVIWAINDPNPRVHAKAQDILEAQSVVVIPHYFPELGAECLKEFHAFHQLNRPYVYVKAAMSLDGMIAPNGDGLNYISSPESLQLVQQLRQNVQAICVGANTINIDQPRLNIRIDQRNDFQPTIVILDPQHCVDMAWVDQSLGAGRNIILFRSDHLDNHYDRLTVISGLTSNKMANWQLVLRTLHAHHIHGLLIEGGSSVFRSILEAGYFDELWVTKVPKLFGAHAIPFVSDGSEISLDVSFISSGHYGADVVLKYRNNHAF
jgi:diaminohydroxyphosphoribosylaminopyrimidine deaminase/5-amino-6-(5-phosphoribosylamino)uracil reductase